MNNDLASDLCPFWTLTISKTAKPTPWGDCVRLVRLGKLVPPPIERWEDLRNFAQRPNHEFDMKEVRAAWAAYERMRASRASHV